MNRIHLRLMTASIFLVGVVLLWAYGPAILHWRENLVFKPEGILDRKLNYRDAGASINQCLGTKSLREGKLMRAAEFFSGWSCERVGQPDVIYSLNFAAAKGGQYYCRTANDVMVGQHFQANEISDIEFIENWQRPSQQVRAVCEFLSRAQRDLDQGLRVLIHCEAGRDRTGAVIALLAAMEFEKNGALTDQQIAAIECDYRKSESLKPYKYGRMTTMLKLMGGNSSVTNFIRDRCQ
jgi:protein-tyrosine phosphatase